jgi:5-methylcytosine-specific restriction endonuclease McrA
MTSLGLSWCEVDFKIKSRKEQKLNQINLIMQPIRIENQKRWSLEYRLKNRENLNLRRRIYRKTAIGKVMESRYRHTRRARIASTENTLTPHQWVKILKSQRNRCSMCGKRFCKSRPPTMDHIVPVSKGGGLTFENVQALCHSCNSSKNASLDYTKLVTWGIFS